MQLLRLVDNPRIPLTPEDTLSQHPTIHRSESTAERHWAGGAIGAGLFVSLYLPNNIVRVARKAYVAETRQRWDEADNEMINDRGQVVAYAKVPSAQMATDANGRVRARLSQFRDSTRPR